MDRIPTGRPASLTLLKRGSIVIPAVGILLWGVLSYLQAERRATALVLSQVELMEEQVHAVLDAQFIVHDAVRAHLRAVPGIRVDGPRMHLFLRDMAKVDPRFMAVGIVEAGGNLAATSAQFPIKAPVRLGDRAYMAQIRAGEERVVDRLQTAAGDTLVAASPLNAVGFQGAIVSGWPFQAMQEFLESTAVDAGHTVAILRTDGLLLFRPGYHPRMIPEDHPLVMAARSRDRGVLTADGLVVPDRRLFAFGKVGHLPLVVVYGVPRAEILRTGLTDAVPVGLLLLASGLFGFALTVAAGRSMESRMSSMAALHRAETAERMAEQKATLLREMNHRIKNNLAVVLSMIRVRQRLGQDAAGSDITGRIEAIMAVHDMLYATEDGASADVGTLLRRIATSPAVVPEERRIALELDLAPGIMLDARRATSTALIVAELLTNAVKHAFAAQPSPVIGIALRRAGPETAEILVRDNGPGLPPQVARRSGIALVDVLARDAGITLTSDSGNGQQFTLSIPLRDPLEEPQPEPEVRPASAA